MFKGEKQERSSVFFISVVLSISYRKLPFKASICKQQGINCCLLEFYGNKIYLKD